MPGRTISRDVKLAAMNLFERDIFPLDDILDIVGFSESTFWRTRKLWRETGDVAKPKSVTSGRRRLLHREDIDYILSLVKLRPDWFLDELLKLVKTNRFISVHFTTIFRELQRLGVSRKKLKKIAAERNELIRMDFVRHMGEYPAHYLGFLDETSKNERTLSRGFGRAKKGRRAMMKEKFVRGTRLTATGLLTLDGMVANTVVEGSMKRADYLEFIEHEVVSTIAVILPGSHVFTDAAYNTFPRPVVCPRDGQRSDTSWRGDSCPGRAFWYVNTLSFIHEMSNNRARCPDRVFTSILTGFQPHRGGVLKNQSVHTPQCRHLLRIHRRWPHL